MSDDLLTTRRFNALTAEWTSEELGRFFWLVPEDMQEVRTCRGAANRLGFALNLLLLRFLHCPLPDVTLTPARIVHFVAMQLNVPPDVLAEYSVRRRATNTWCRFVATSNCARMPMQGMIHASPTIC